MTISITIGQRKSRELGGYATHFTEAIRVADFGDALKSESPNIAIPGITKVSRGCSAPSCPWVAPLALTHAQAASEFNAHKAQDHIGEDAHYYRLIFLYQAAPGLEGDVHIEGEGGGGVKETERI